MGIWDVNVLLKTFSTYSEQICWAYIAQIPVKNISGDKNDSTSTAQGLVR